MWLVMATAVGVFVVVATSNFGRATFVVMEEARVFAVARHPWELFAQHFTVVK